MTQATLEQGAGMQQPAVHGLAWAAWLGAVLVIAAMTRNPWYLGVALCWVGLVHAAARLRPGRGHAGWLWPAWRFGLFVIPIAAFFNLLTVHVGSTVLLRLPRTWLLIGGPLTLESAWYGALNGVALTTIFAAFGVANRMLPLREIIQLIPRAYYPVAVVMAIALTFVPGTLAQWRQIREAQAVRGHRLRGIRSWLPLWLPLVTGGMERALQLAEAMTARGFAGGSNGLVGWPRRAILAGLPAVLVGLLLRTVWGLQLWGISLALLGAVAVGVAIWTIGRRRPHTRYRPARWRQQDWFVSAGALLTSLLYLLPLEELGRATLFYSPYPVLRWPDFSIFYGVATWGLLVPLFVWLLAPQQTTQVER